MESYKSLKKEAIQMGTKIEWNEENLGISQNNLEEQIIEISQALSEARDLKRKNEEKDKKISDSICSKGPDLKLPKINSPCDILLWVKSFKQMSAFIPSELTKIAIIKASLIGKDKKAVEHLSSVGSILSYIHTNYLKPDLILNILLKQAYSISEPWTLAQSLKNIDEWLLLVTSFF